MFCAVLFCGINTASSVLPYVTTERIVFYRERFSGMYAHWAYPLAQVTTKTTTKKGTNEHIFITFDNNNVFESYSKQLLFPGVFAGHN